MQTRLPDALRATEDGREADRILRNCVHCGFCNATCPTYQLLGDELDGPRGRIYQIKSLLEGEAPSAVVRGHLDRCLTCRACETTCPSGVHYSRLLDLGRERLERDLPRPWWDRWRRRALRAVLPYPRRFTPLLRAAQGIAPLLPRGLRRQVPPRRRDRAEAGDHPRAMVLHRGCVQGALAPQIDAAAVRVLDTLGVSLRPAPGSGCCGAVSHHLGATAEARAFARRNIDAWWPAIEAGAEALVVTASGCTAMIRDYGHLLRDDPAYAERAERVAALARDPAQVLAQEDLSRLPAARGRRRVAFHAPCTLQHALGLPGATEALLARRGHELTPVPDAHLCCGSAGTYSLLQPRIAGELRRRKLDALEGGNPAVIATANIGCLMHLQAGTEVPVRHWLELLDPHGSQNDEPKRRRENSSP